MINVRTADAVTVLELAHGKVNAMDVELLEGIAAELRRLADAGTSALVVTGAGRVFSAGVDLNRVLAGGAGYVDRLIPALSDAFETLFRFPAPTVAAVNGAAIAGGCILACACDRRIIHTEAAIGASELRVGVPFPAVALEVLRHACGDHAEEVVLGAGLHRGEAAVALRLAHEVTAAAELMDRAVAVAADLATVAGDGYRLAKAALRRPAVERMRAGEAGDAEARRIWAAPATAEAIRRQLERTARR